MVHDIFFSDEKLNPSARYLPDADSERMWDELRDIHEQHGIHMQYVMNSSVWKNDVYLEGKQQIIDTVNDIHSRGATMLTINNMYLLRDVEFRDKIPQDLVLKLSINNKVATLEEVEFLYTHSGIDHFILDRSINRNMDEIQRICEWEHRDKITLTLLAQEGCISKCPWKSTCDNMISTFRDYDAHEVNDLKAKHSTHFCTAHYTANPQDVLKSPWITPSGVELYDDYIDYMKLSGRMSPIAKMSRVFDSYLQRDSLANLPDMLAIHNDSVLINSNVNDLETHGYSAKVHNCKNMCASCDFCDKLYEKLANDN